MITDEVSPIFKSLVYDVAVKAIIADAMIALSLSPTGFTAVLLTKIAIKFANWLYPKIETRIKIGEVKLKNEIHQKQYEHAQLKLKIILREKGIDSDEFKNERNLEHDKLLKLVVYNV